MKIQLGNSSYIQSVKKDSSNRLFDALFLDKHKKSKATYEIKKEDGYIRHYVTKANGEKVMITEMVMNHLTKAFDKEQFDKFSKTGLAAQKEKPLAKYSTGI